MSLPLSSAGADPGAPAAAPAAGGPTCATFGSLSTTGKVASPLITEASGLVASRANPGVFWTHNDNRGDNRVFAIDATGQLLATVRLQGAVPVNTEDIAIGPGPSGGDNLYLGDIGDNGNRRADVAVYRFPEPGAAALTGGQIDLAPTAYEVFTFRYHRPGVVGATWSRDAEAMAVDPVTRRLYVFEKQYNWIGGPRMSWVYSADLGALSSASVNVLEPLVALKSNIFTPETAGFTGADISADGRLVVVKNRRDLFTWLREPGETVEQALARAPQSVCPGPGAVGEAVGILADSSGYVMVREGLASPVWKVGLSVPPAAWTCGGLVPNLLGTPGDDVLVGGPGRDVIVGGRGNDTIDGAGGDDVICGGAGQDVVAGAAGEDVVHGNAGDDDVEGGIGDDRLFGEDGSDAFDPGPGANRIVDRPEDVARIVTRAPVTTAGT